MAIDRFCNTLSNIRNEHATILPDTIVVWLLMRRLAHTDFFLGKDERRAKRNTSEWCARTVSTQIGAPYLFAMPVFLFFVQFSSCDVCVFDCKTLLLANTPTNHCLLFILWCAVISFNSNWNKSIDLTYLSNNWAPDEGKFERFLLAFEIRKREKENTIAMQVHSLLQSLRSGRCAHRESQTHSAWKTKEKCAKIAFYNFHISSVRVLVCGVLLSTN